MVFVSEMLSPKVKFYYSFLLVISHLPVAEVRIFVFIFAQYNTYVTNSLISTRDELDRKALIEHQ